MLEIEKTDRRLIDDGGELLSDTQRDRERSGGREREIITITVIVNCVRCWLAMFQMEDNRLPTRVS